MTYNIHHANPPSKAGLIDIAAIAKVINQQQPDLVAIQEVDVNTKRAGMNEAEVLSKATHMNVYFAKAIDYDGGDYGVVLLSRYPLSNAKTVHLPTLQGTNGEPRVLATAEITLPGKKKITFACTHLDAQRKDDNRIAQINTIIDKLQGDVKTVIIGGDFNATAESEVIQMLDRSFRRTCTENCGFTIPQINPTKTIDFIAYKKGTVEMNVISHKVIDEQYASDHLPVVAEFEIK